MIPKNSTSPRNVCTKTFTTKTFLAYLEGEGKFSEISTNSLSVFWNYPLNTTTTLLLVFAQHWRNKFDQIGEVIRKTCTPVDKPPKKGEFFFRKRKTQQLAIVNIPSKCPIYEKIVPFPVLRDEELSICDVSFSGIFDPILLL